MSSLLALQTNEAVIFASDTSLSIQHNNKSFRVANNENKLFEYPNFIMFASGKKYLVDRLIGILPSSPSIIDVQLTLDNHILKYSEKYSLEVVIAMKDLSKMIFFSSTNGFRYSESISNEYTNLFTAGCKTKEVSDKFEKYYESYPLFQSLEKTYKELSCSELGGNLDVFYLTKDELKTYQIKIDDIPIVDENVLYKELLSVHANKLVGKIILSKKLWVEDELGIVEIQSGLQTIYDQNGVPRVFLGRYPTYDDPTIFDYGLRIDNGSFTMRTSPTDKRGVQIDGDGIRAYNNNGVKTFEINAQTGQVSIIGGISIKTHPDSNRGVEIDGNGLRIYNDSGMLVFNADHYGNIFYRGKLDGAYGDVDDLGGSIKDMDGTFKGDLVAAGGTFTGTLNGVDGDFSGELKAATGTFGGLVTGTLDTGIVTADSIKAGAVTSDKIQANSINADRLNVSELSAISSNLGTITAGDINIDSDMTIGNNLYIGTHWQNQGKSIIFGGALGAARIDYDNDALNINATSIIIDSGAVTRFYGTVDFSGANVIGI